MTDYNKSNRLNSDGTRVRRVTPVDEDNNDLLGSPSDEIQTNPGASTSLFSLLKNLTSIGARTDAADTVGSKGTSIMGKLRGAVQHLATLAGAVATGFFKAKLYDSAGNDIIGLSATAADTDGTSNTSKLMPRIRGVLQNLATLAGLAPLNTVATSTATVTAGQTASGAVDISGYKIWSIVIPSIVTNCAVYIQLADVSGSTHYRLYDAVNAADWTIASGVEQKVVDLGVLPAGSLKVEIGSSQAADLSFTLIGRK